jgi:hypothetical protein
MPTPMPQKAADLFNLMVSRHLTRSIVRIVGMFIPQSVAHYEVPVADGEGDRRFHAPTD